MNRVDGRMGGSTSHERRTTKGSETMSETEKRPTPSVPGRPADDGPTTTRPGDVGQPKPEQRPAL